MLKEMPIWTWIVSENESQDESIWRVHGGKWLIYGNLFEMERLGHKLDKYVENGEITSAKFWNAGKTSAMCVYSLDRNREKTKRILFDLGFKPTAWEYDYARIKNWTRPRFFLSAFYKLRILLRTFGIFGTLRFIIGAYM